MSFSTDWIWEILGYFFFIRSNIRPSRISRADNGRIYLGSTLVSNWSEKILLFDNATSITAQTVVNVVKGSFLMNFHIFFRKIKITTMSITRMMIAMMSIHEQIAPIFLKIDSKNSFNSHCGSTPFILAPFSYSKPFGSGLIVLILRILS